MNVDEIISNIRSPSEDERKLVADFVLKELDLNSGEERRPEVEIYTDERLPGFDQNNDAALKPHLETM